MGLVPEARWNIAQAFEARAWAAAAYTANASHAGAVPKGVYGLMDGLDTWLRAQRESIWDVLPVQKLGASLGRVAEVGAGPYTQTLAMLSRWPGLHAASMSAIDPGIPGYLSLGTATYANGTLNHTDVPVEMLPIGVEKVRDGDQIHPISALTAIGSPPCPPTNWRRACDLVLSRSSPHATLAPSTPFSSSTSSKCVTAF